MSQSQMDEAEQLCDCSVRQREISKLYQLMNLSVPWILEEIDKRKRDGIDIDEELKRLSYWYEKMERLKEYIQGAFDYENRSLLMRSIPWTNGFLNLTEYKFKKKEIIQKLSGYGYSERVNVHVGTGVKRCPNRLKKDRMDLGYLQLIQEQLLLMKPTGMPIHGTQELNRVMKSLVHRVQHGSNNEADEHKIFHEIEKIKKAIEIYAAPTQPDLGEYNRYWRNCATQREQSLHKQHGLKLAVDRAEKIEVGQKNRNAKKRQLEADREQVKNSVRCMQRVLEEVETKNRFRFTRVCKHLQPNIGYTIYTSKNKYRRLMTNVKEFARKGDVMGLMQFLDLQSRIED